MKILITYPQWVAARLDAASEWCDRPIMHCAQCKHKTTLVNRSYSWNFWSTWMNDFLTWRLVRNGALSETVKSAAISVYVKGQYIFVKECTYELYMNPWAMTVWAQLYCISLSAGTTRTFCNRDSSLEASYIVLLFQWGYVGICFMFKLAWLGSCAAIRVAQSSILKIRFLCDSANFVY
jgi:hypothetical protein